VIRKSERKRPLARHRRGWENNIKINLKEKDARVCNGLMWLETGTNGALL
jgi:hypothetical protein